MICNTCGRSNPAHLVFCEECGQRLAPRMAAGAPLPTAPPPYGAARVPSAAPPPLPDLPAQGPWPPQPQGGTAKRPPAPEVNFGPRVEPGARPPDTVTCAHCGNVMQAGLRYCGECGRPQLDTSTFQAVVLGTGLSSDAGRATTGGSRVCPRCRGASDPSATFCRYCGLPLTGPSIHGAPAPALALASSFTPGGTAVALSPTPAPVAPAQAPRPAAAPTPLVSTASMVEATAARLVVIARDGTEGPSFPLGEVTDIGRAEGQIVVADDRHLSPRHARITFRGGVFLLSDLGSTNGLFVRIPFSPAAPLRPQVASVDRAARSKEADAEHPLEDQDLFLVGQQVLRFEVVNDTEQGFRVAFDNGTLLFGTPVTARHARLIQVGVEGGARDVYYLRKAETIIGRESGDIVFTDDPFLSRRHATVRMHGGGTGSDGARASRRFVLADLGSSNGTFLQTRGEVVLKPGDQFRVGQQLFRFDLGGPRVDA